MRFSSKTKGTLQVILMIPTVVSLFASRMSHWGVVRSVASRYPREVRQGSLKLTTVSESTLRRLNLRHLNTPEILLLLPLPLLLFLFI